MTHDCDPASIKALKARMKAYHEELAEQAEKVIFIVLPSKILELSQLIDSFNSADSPFTASHPSFQCDSAILSLPSTIPTEGYRPSYGRGASPSLSNSSAAGGSTPDKVKSNLESLPDAIPVFGSIDASHDAGALGGEHEDDKPIRTGLRTNPIFDIVGKIMDQQGTEVLQFCLQIRRWMATVAPQVEEGNNTGVEIQELAMSYLNSLQNMGSNCSDYLSTTRQNRGGMARLYLRSPGIEDRMLALYEGDKRELFSARQILNLLQTKCMETMNIFQKNWIKICEPKGRSEVRWD
ncbi:hypothetical protein QFC20_007023 [Naganishia adeliensis]|uniref:Uncharacterized protein n=1 Tax=Naganishia adeliensis TaxID=92952 RepID=A0ACC2V3L3_9TREE|nr:hypothetical protein QFC20_007023 [Naganishia adeliensis]